MTDDKEKKKKPKKHVVDNYDYSKICNYPGCEEEAEICPKCLERTGQERLGHRHPHIKLRTNKKGENVYEQTLTHIKIIDKIIHTHFALRKGTQIPELDVARNVRCNIGEKWANKARDCYTTIKLKGAKGVPNYLKDDYNDD